jgi:hypothetical protein
MRRRYLYGKPGVTRVAHPDDGLDFRAGGITINRCIGVSDAYIQAPATAQSVFHDLGTPQPKSLISRVILVPGLALSGPGTKGIGEKTADLRIFSHHKLGTGTTGIKGIDPVNDGLDTRLDGRPIVVPASGRVVDYLRCSIRVGA